MSDESSYESRQDSQPPEGTLPIGASQVDVARLAGVSQAAVSRTFTPGTSVSRKTRAKVLAAAEQLGYRPNVIARSLIRKSTNMIGLVVMRFTNPFYARMIRDFTRALQDLGYWTLLLNIAEAEEVEQAIPTALQYQVDGLIITSATLSSTLAKACARSGTPVVLFNRYASSDDVHVVRCDNVLGGRLVAETLLDAGHRRLAYIAGEDDSSTNHDREQGFVERLRERGQPLAFRERAGDCTYEAGHAGAQRLLQREDPPDGIFCANDLIAMGALDVARMGGPAPHPCRVAEDVSIIGFDDIPMAAWPGYNLTTVRQPVEEMVEATIHVLIEDIDSPSPQPVVRVIAPTLVVRSSARVTANG